jgi:hypothetical protein
MMEDQEKRKFLKKMSSILLNNKNKYILECENIKI